jgi:hypothetical protein
VRVASRARWHSACTRRDHTRAIAIAIAITTAIAIADRAREI